MYKIYYDWNFLLVAWLKFVFNKKIKIIIIIIFFNYIVFVHWKCGYNIQFIYYLKPLFMIFREMPENGQKLNYFQSD